MTRKAISENIKRKLYAESMGRCMNPNCEVKLFLANGDIAEKAHIVPHCNTVDNSFENLILLCPNCHTNFDKNATFTKEEVKTWKIKRQEQISKIFTQQFGTFKELEDAVKPLLEENKTIYENYYLQDNAKLWIESEEKILVNNQKLKLLLENNKRVIQTHSNKEYSNLEIINKFLLHIEEFNITRKESEKIRSVLFPEKINSIFGIKPIDDSVIPSIEALECLIAKFQKENIFIKIAIGVNNPFIEYKEGDKTAKLFLKDIPRIRQKYFEYQCFRKAEVRFDSLNFALQYMNNNDIKFILNDFKKLTNVSVGKQKFKFIYKYCLSKAELVALAPKKNLVIVNLHNWNGLSCISKEAYEQAEIMSVKLLTMNDFYKYVHQV